jgi:hypothetical protein
VSCVRRDLLRLSPGGGLHTISRMAVALRSGVFRQCAKTSPAGVDAKEAEILEVRESACE